MKKEFHKKLLQNRQVIEEINRHLWIESEKAGFDIGFEKASEDWLTRFSKAWMDYHMPKENQAVIKTKDSQIKKSPSTSLSKKNSILKARK